MRDVSMEPIADQDVARIRHGGRAGQLDDDRMTAIE
jgi:hypothetical protein